MPPKDSATEMIYRILDNMSGIGVNYDVKTNTITYTNPTLTNYGDLKAVDSCYATCTTEHKCSQCENWKQKEEETKMKNDAKPAPVYSPFAIRSVLSNRKKNAFTVVWADGTSTVVHCQPGDDWDDEKALAMCFTKKALGNRGNFNDKFNDALDNKMKTIPAEPAPEKACECKMTVASIGENRNGSYLTKEIIENASTEEAIFKKPSNAFGLSKQTTDELTKVATKANVALKDMIDALTGETASKTSKNENTPVYRVFIRISGKSHHDSDFTSIEALRERVHQIAEEHYGRKPYYYRTWMGDNGRMIMDFGHYTQFIEIEGITPSEYAKN